jgi:hypothetical protein
VRGCIWRNGRSEHSLQHEKTWRREIDTVLCLSALYALLRAAAPTMPRAVRWTSRQQWISSLAVIATSVLAVVTVRCYVSRFTLLLGALLTERTDWATRIQTAAYAPNHFLGTCLDEKWVSSMEATLNVSRNDRDSLGRLVHPFLQPAMAHTRFKVRGCSSIL